MKRCPRDQETLASNDVDGYRYHSCEDCHGFWIPGDSLTRALSDRGLDNFRQLPALSVPGVKCPDCHQACQVVVLHGCTLDMCERCRGVWFDAGEVERVKTLFPRRSAVVDAGGAQPGKEDLWTGVEVIDLVIQLVLLVSH